MGDRDRERDRQILQHQQLQQQQQHQQQQHQGGQKGGMQLAKAATAVTAGGSFMILSGLTLVGTVIALTLATPLLVLFSPVLVPAGIALMVLLGGFLASGGFGVAAVTTLAWMYKYVKGSHPVGADQLDHARMKLASKAREMKEFGQHQLTGSGERHSS
ncbi:hypothetical protein GIB67_015560 [Kingdonia uniflora]|uniref:Oleosin n=1 Tax=Kingdonia uniflora TaxID=39325 RepID=A0A7J7LUA6_9MAGN|nr:hypothetical protein GIB67_015560 [Kingdonia uniflora]